MKSIQSRTYLRDQVIEYFSGLSDFNSIKRTKKILIGFSGGPDSMCLMHILHTLEKELDIEIVLAYFNHRLRSAEELGGELDFINRIAKKYDIRLEIGVDDGTISNLSGEIGIECAARRARYDFFDRSMVKYGCDFLALAHNADDTIETLVMRFFKGSGLGGLKGIPTERGNIIRPLSTFPKSELLEYLREIGESYSLDTTNLGTDYLRNRVRNVILPCVREIFPSCTKTLMEFADKVALADDFIKSQTEELASWKLSSNGNYLIEYKVFMSLPGAVRIESVYRCFDIFAKGRTAELPYRFVRTVLDKKTVRRGSLLLKGYGFKIRRNGDYLEWQPDIENNDDSYYIDIHGCGSFRTGDGRSFSVERSLLSSHNEDDIWIPSCGVVGRLCVRSWKNGDFILSGGFRKKLKKIFSDWKIPVEKRAMIPVICDSRGVVAVWGGFYGFRNRVSDLVRLNDEKECDGDVYIFKIRQDGCGR